MYCQFTFPLNYYSLGHRVKCGKGKCKWEGTVNQLNKHRENQCLYTEIPCKYKPIGCKMEKKRKDMETHEQDGKAHLPVLDTLLEHELKKSENTAESKKRSENTTESKKKSENTAESKKRNKNIGMIVWLIGTFLWWSFLWFNKYLIHVYNEDNKNSKTETIESIEKESDDKAVKWTEHSLKISLAIIVLVFCCCCRYKS